MFCSWLCYVSFLLILPGSLIILYHDFEDPLETAHEFNVEKAARLLTSLENLHDDSSYLRTLHSRANFIEEYLTNLENVVFQFKLLNATIDKSFRDRSVGVRNLPFFSARVASSSSLPSSPAVSVHFDTAIGVVGTSDNLMAVAVALEAFRVASLKHLPLTLLIGGGEELGLLGAETFIRSHPWADELRNSPGIINFDAAGAGGPPFLVRASGASAVFSALQSRKMNSVFLFASSLGQDLQDLGLVRSNTDYAAFSMHHFPIVDFAMLDAGQVYHSSFDDHRLGPSPRSMSTEGEIILAVASAIKQQEEEAEDTIPPPSFSALSFFSVGGRLFSLSIGQSVALAFVSLLCNLFVLLRSSSSLWASLAPILSLVACTAMTIFIAVFLLPPYFMFASPMLASFILLLVAVSLAYLSDGGGSRDSPSGIGTLFAGFALSLAWCQFRCAPLVATFAFACAAVEAITSPPVKFAAAALPIALFLEHSVVLGRFFAPLVAWSQDFRKVHALFALLVSLFIFPVTFLSLRIFLTSSMSEDRILAKNRICPSLSLILLCCLYFSINSQELVFTDSMPRRIIMQHHPDSGKVVWNTLDSLPIASVDRVPLSSAEGSPPSTALRFHPTQKILPPLYEPMTLITNRLEIPPEVSGKVTITEKKEKSMIRFSLDYPEAWAIRLLLSPCSTGNDLLFSLNNTEEKSKLASEDCSLELFSFKHGSSWTISLHSESSSFLPKKMTVSVFSDICKECQEPPGINLNAASILQATVYEETIKMSV